jgi:hypothetical protein
LRRSVSSRRTITTKEITNECQQATAIIAEYDTAYKAGDSTHPALNGADPAHMDVMADLLAARGVLAAQPPPAPTEPKPRERLSSAFTRGGVDLAAQRRKDARTESIKFAEAGNIAFDRIDDRAQSLIDDVYNPHSTTPLALAFRDPTHPKHAEAQQRVLAARRAIQGNDEVVLRIGETVEQLAERAAREAEEADNAGPMRFDETIENPSDPETGDHLSSEEWQHYGRAAAAEGVSTSTVQTVVAAFLTSQHFPDATDDDLRRFFGPSFKEEIPYADRALKWLDKNAPSHRIRAALRRGVPVPVWAALARAGREMDGSFVDKPVLKVKR